MNHQEKELTYLFDKSTQEKYCKFNLVAIVYFFFYTSSFLFVATCSPLNYYIAKAQFRWLACLARIDGRFTKVKRLSL